LHILHVDELFAGTHQHQKGHERRVHARTSTNPEHIQTEKKQSNRSEQKILYESELHSEAKPNTLFPGQNLKKVFANPWHG